MKHPARVLPFVVKPAQPTRKPTDAEILARLAVERPGHANFLAIVAEKMLARG